MKITRSQVKFLSAELSGSSPYTSNLFAAYDISDEDFDLEDCVEANGAWSNPRGADGVRLIRQYKIGRYEDRILYAVVTESTYLLNGIHIPSEEFFRIVNAPGFDKTTLARR